MGTLYFGSQRVSPIMASGSMTVDTDSPQYKTAILLQGLDSNGILKSLPAEDIVFLGVENIDDSVLKEAYKNNTRVRTASFPALTEVSGDNACYNAFQGCNNLISTNLSLLEEVSGDYACYSAFHGCTSLTTADLSSLTTVSGQNGCLSMFSYCTSLTSFDLSSLTTVSGNYGCSNMFSHCTSLTAASLLSLTTVSGSCCCQNMFYDCSSLTSLSFPALTSNSFGSSTNQFVNMLNGVTGCTVHFPSNLQSVIGSWSDVTSGFGGTNTTVLFDLPATE